MFTQVQDAIKDFADKNNRLATLRAVKHHCQYLSQLKATAESRGVKLVSDTGMGSIMRAVLCGCVQIDKPDAAARTHSRALAECPRNGGNVWACREHLRVGPVWGLSREEAKANPAPAEVTFPSHSSTREVPPLLLRWPVKCMFLYVISCMTPYLSPTHMRNAGQFKLGRRNFVYEQHDGLRGQCYPRLQ